jgi:hypothetical protein
MTIRGINIEPRDEEVMSKSLRTRVYELLEMRHLTIDELSARLSAPLDRVEDVIRRLRDSGEINKIHRSGRYFVAHDYLPESARPGSYDG